MRNILVATTIVLLVSACESSESRRKITEIDNNINIINNKSREQDSKIISLESRLSSTSDALDSRVSSSMARINASESKNAQQDQSIRNIELLLDAVMRLSCLTNIDGTIQRVECHQ